MMGVIINRDNSGDIKVTYPYNAIYLSKIKTIPGRKCHPDGKYPTFPYSKVVFDQVYFAFAGEDPDTDPSLRPLVR